MRKNCKGREIHTNSYNALRSPALLLPPNDLRGAFTWVFFQPASEGHCGNSKVILLTKHRQSRPFVLSAGGQPVHLQQSLTRSSWHCSALQREVKCWSFVCLCVTLRQAPSLGVSDSAATCHGSSAPGRSKCLNCEGTAIPQGKPKYPRSAPLPNHAVGPARLSALFFCSFLRRSTGISLQTTLLPWHYACITYNIN